MADPTILWLTSRSAYEEGLDRCLQARFLGYHFGPYGYGIQRKAQSMPLATGIYYHRSTEGVNRYLLAHDQLPPDAVVRESIKEAVDEYERVITLRGIRNLADSERLEIVIQEQKGLIEGLTWAYALTFLPWLHEQCRVIDVEHEELMVLGCTCGLGNRIGELGDHEARGCEGIGFQSRPDLITEYRARPGVNAYWELKGTAMVGERFETEWETKIQFVAGAMASQARLGIPISEAWVIGLVKGRREGEYNWETKKKDGARIQQTPLCYGWRRPGNPPLEPADWQAKYDYVDTTGKNRRLGKEYKKAGIWQLVDDMPELRASGLSVPEFWAKWIPQDTLGQCISLVGPLQINQTLENEMLGELVEHERWWKWVVWELYRVLNEECGGDWTHPNYRAALSLHLPRSWACRRFGKHYQCQMVPICFQHEGWRDPLGSGVFVPRRPHHDPELKQVEARGLLPEGGWTDEEEIE